MTIALSMPVFIRLCIKIRWASWGRGLKGKERTDCG